ncbi:hypothetical protein, partial [Ferviditalea candida]|nr:hypothetical protein [Paenibacillaceae bacterium T2]
RAVNVQHSMTQHTGGAFCFANRILIHYRNSSLKIFVQKFCTRESLVVQSPSNGLEIKETIA